MTRKDSTKDRRIIELHLTEQGHALAERLSGSTHKSMVARWVAKLPEDQRTAFGQILHTLLDIIENDPG